MPSDVRSLVKTEWSFGFAAATAVFFETAGKQWLLDLASLPWMLFALVWFLAVIVASVFSVVRHADALALTFGEPFGTLVLTLSVISIEVMVISAVMLAGDENPSLARETVYSGIMIVLNGVIGSALLIGGWRHREQEYNLSGANAFLSVIAALAIIGLVLPSHTISTAGPSFSPTQEIFMILVCLGLYSVLLGVQTVRHRHYFVEPRFVQPGSSTTTSKSVDDRPEALVGSAPLHGVLLIFHLLPVAVLAEEMGIPLNHMIETVGAPEALGGFVIAIMILLPETMSSLRASFANDVQRSINITLGSVAATIGLTIPAVLGVGLLMGHTLELGLGGVDQVMLMLTLLLCLITFGSGRTNILQGAVHLVMFFTYFVLMFD